MISGKELLQKEKNNEKESEWRNTKETWHST